MRDQLATLLEDFDVLPDRPAHLTDRQGERQAGSRLDGASADPAVAEAIAFTLRYAHFVTTERRQAPVIGEGK